MNSDMIWVEEWRGDDVRQRLVVCTTIQSEAMCSAELPIFGKCQAPSASCNRNFAVFVVNVSVAFTHADSEDHVEVRVPATIRTSRGRRY